MGVDYGAPPHHRFFREAHTSVPAGIGNEVFPLPPLHRKTEIRIDRQRLLLHREQLAFPGRGSMPPRPQYR